MLGEGGHDPDSSCPPLGLSLTEGLGRMKEAAARVTAMEERMDVLRVLMEQREVQVRAGDKRVS